MDGRGCQWCQPYAYSADGLRQQKQAGVTVTYFVWDQQNVLLEQQ